MTMEIIVNGTPRELAGETSIADLLGLLKINSQQVVIELNRQIVPRQQHSETQLQHQDAVEIVHFVGGG